MKIGIDIDDTTFLTIKSMLKYADKYQEEITGKARKNDSLGLVTNRYYLKVLYGWDDQTKFTFFNKYYKSVLEECELIPNANKVINKLKDDGNKIYFITARLMNIDGCDTKNITKESLRKFGINYDELYLGVKDKLTFCKDNNIDLLIEDSYETCLELVNNGVKAMLMTTKMNENIDAKDIPRVSSWIEIYDLIKNI